MRSLSHLVLALALTGAGCSLDLTSNAGFCNDDSDCSGTQRCERFAGRDDGLCIDPGDPDAGMMDGGPLLDAGPVDAGTDAGRCVADAPCYSGPDGTAGVGACAMGAIECVGTTAFCRNEVLPASDDTCDGADQDCDGVADEEAPVLGNCTIGAPGVCAAGEQRCVMGSYGCRPAAEAVAETCNSLDDDCDDIVDEDASIECYGAATGCTQQADGSYECVGVCAAGRSACVDGSLEASCAGATEPTAETCTGDPAFDEDCDGLVDEGCSCANTTTQDCYPGPAEVAGNGPCELGTQTCAGGAWGVCDDGSGGALVLPEDETCANAGGDNDCNGTVDDVPGQGESCLDMAGMGVCRRGALDCVGNDLICETPAPMANETFCDSFDEDCDGTVDEDFDLTTDDAHCGACGRGCGDNFECCDSDCRATATDPMYCGSCGVSCEGATPDCCGAACTDTETDAANCGECGNACGDGLSCCGGECVDPLSDATNCNGCGNLCDQGANTACCNGACADPSTTACTDCAEDCTAPTDTCCTGTCVDQGSNPSHCGGCGAACTGNDNACCGADGCTDTRTDEMHCGGCDMPACTGSTPDCCDSSCTDTMEDSLNCGMCGNACSAGDICCGGNCVDPQSDDMFCGSCDIDCSAAAQACSAGNCCEPETPTFCPQAGDCIDTDTNNAHCGECGNACGAEQTCCGGSCVNTAEDENNCGQCGEPCTGSDDTCCDSACVNTDTDNGDCGVCGRFCVFGCNGSGSCNLF